MNQIQSDVIRKAVDEHVPITQAVWLIPVLEAFALALGDEMKPAPPEEVDVSMRPGYRYKLKNSDDPASEIVYMLADVNGYGDRVLVNNRGIRWNDPKSPNAMQQELNTNFVLVPATETS